MPAEIMDFDKNKDDPGDTGATTSCSPESTFVQDEKTRMKRSLVWEKLRSEYENLLASEMLDRILPHPETKMSKRAWEKEFGKAKQKLRKIANHIEELLKDETS